MTLALLLLTLAAPPAWEQTSKNEHCVVYNRARAGTDVKEVLAVGTFDAPLEKVHAVLDDVGAYSEFMPYTKETRVMKREGDVVWNYERINAPLVSDRDYTVRISHERVGPGVKHVFTVDNAKGPAVTDGVVRVQVLEGYWLLEPLSPTTTKGTYYVYTTPGGSLPTFVVNGANNSAVPGLYEAIKKRLATKR